MARGKKGGGKRKVLLFLNKSNIKMSMIHSKLKKTCFSIHPRRFLSHSPSPCTKSHMRQMQMTEVYFSLECNLDLLLSLILAVFHLALKQAHTDGSSAKDFPYYKRDAL